MPGGERGEGRPVDLPRLGGGRRVRRSGEIRPAAIDEQGKLDVEGRMAPADEERDIHRAGVARAKAFVLPWRVQDGIDPAMTSQAPIIAIVLHCWHGPIEACPWA